MGELIFSVAAAIVSIGFLIVGTFAWMILDESE